jgi:hypothetical protein
MEVQAVQAPLAAVMVVVVTKLVLTQLATQDLVAVALLQHPAIQTHTPVATEVLVL